MIRMFENPKLATRRIRRRRISHSLAVFAALMLFASTQVGQTTANDPVSGTGAETAGLQSAEVDQAYTLSVEGTATANPDPRPVATDEPADVGISQKTSSSGSKSRSSGLKFNLFLIRG